MTTNSSGTFVLNATRGAFVGASARTGAFVIPTWLVPVTVVDGAFVPRDGSGFCGYHFGINTNDQTPIRMKQTTITIIEVRSMKTLWRYVNSRGRARRAHRAV